MGTGTLQIHSENILPIIKKWLYSSHDIFVRELTSNSCDAISKVKLLSEHGEAEKSDEYRVDVKIDKDAKTITFSDNGIGMDASEVEKYIAQIAFSGAEEFMQKYKGKTESDQFIGHFGLGFYSAYMVSDKVDINTLSYKKNAKPAFWSCDGSSEYILEEGKKETRGTDITLHINEESVEFLEESRLKGILNQYCSFLPYPLYLNGSKINTHEPLWMKAPSECKESDYLDFYKHLYPFEEPPLFWVHLNVDYPFHLKGILYFPEIHREFDFAKNTVKLYCNRVFVADNCKDVIPEYLMVLRGVIDSPDIPLNVSRSALQIDRTVKQLASHISKKVAESLTTLYNTDRKKYNESWKDISPIVKLGAIQDEKFQERVKSLLIWRTISNEWLNLSDYLERNQAKTEKKVFYTFDQKMAGDEAVSHLYSLYKEKGIDVLLADFRLDPYLFNVLEGKESGVTFKRIDSEAHEHLVDKSREKSVLDAEGKTEAGKLADFYRRFIDPLKFEVEAKSLAKDQIPALVVMDENDRRMRDYFRMMQGGKGEGVFPERKRTLVLNTNNHLVTALPKLESKDPSLVKELAEEVIDLSLLSQSELEPKALHQFTERTSLILEKMMKLIAS